MASWLRSSPSGPSSAIGPHSPEEILSVIVTSATGGRARLAAPRATLGWAELAADRFGPGRSAPATCYPTTEGAWLVFGVGSPGTPATLPRPSRQAQSHPTQACGDHRPGEQLLRVVVTRCRDAFYERCA